jgi:hypothetical protein
VDKYGEWWFRLWQVFLSWSSEIASEGTSTCFMILCNKNKNKFNRDQWIGEQARLAQSKPSFGLLDMRVPVS